MLSGYFDETGHSGDEKQLFNGMAGVLAPADHWEAFEEKWKQTLKAFKIPFFHMKDFANFKGFFEGWSEDKRRHLYGKLLAHMETAYIFPVGVSISMSAFRSFPEEQRKKFIDPYYLGFLAVITQTTVFMNNAGMSPEEKAELIFSDQVEFKGKAHGLYDEIIRAPYDTVQMLSTARLVKSRILLPVFRDMRDFAALQAADVVAYEVYKEHERLSGARQGAKPRHGYLKLTEMSNRLGYDGPFCKFYARPDLADFIQTMEAEERRKAYWAKKKVKA
ncbi:MAG: DUF3800 domain-containing protein [Chitinophagaceae bacterium]